MFTYEGGGTLGKPFSKLRSPSDLNFALSSFRIGSIGLNFEAEPRPRLELAELDPTENLPLSDPAVLWFDVAAMTAWMSSSIPRSLEALSDLRLTLVIVVEVLAETEEADRLALTGFEFEEAGKAESSQVVVELPPILISQTCFLLSLFIWAVVVVVLISATLFGLATSSAMTSSMISVLTYTASVSWRLGIGDLLEWVDCERWTARCLPLEEFVEADELDPCLRGIVCEDTDDMLSSVLAFVLSEIMDPLAELKFSPEKT